MSSGSIVPQAPSTTLFCLEWNSSYFGAGQPCFHRNIADDVLVDDPAHHLWLDELVGGHGTVNGDLYDNVLGAEAHAADLVHALFAEGGMQALFGHGLLKGLEHLSGSGRHACPGPYRP